MWPNWPDSRQPVEQLLAKAIAIDPKLVRAKSEPKFFRTGQNKKERLNLDSEIDGLSVRDISLDERIRLQQEGQEPSMSVYSLIDRVFDDKYDSKRDKEIAWAKVDP